MNEKDQIQEIILLGTFNYPAVDALDLLEKGAREALAQKAGFLPQKSDFKAAKPFSDELPLCKMEASKILVYILKHKKRALLREFLLLADKKKVRVPTEFIPQLAETSVDFPELKPLMLPILGKWGSYVAEQNDEWKLWQASNSKNWTVGTLRQKKGFLQSEFKKNPEKAVILIEKFALSASKSEHETFFSDLEISNSAPYKEFLLHQFKNKKSKLRLFALRNLAILGDTNILNELERIFKTLFTIQNSKLILQIPVGKSPLWELGFDKKNWIENFCACLPFEFWQKQFELNTEKLLELMLNSQHGEALFLGTLSHALAAKNETLTAQIFKKSYSDLQIYNSISQETRKKILARAKQTSLQDFANLIFTRFGLGDFYFLVNEFVKYSSVWTASFAQKFLFEFENKLTEAQTAIFLNKTLLDLVHQLPLHFFEEVNTGWQEIAHKLPSLAWQIERALHEFRIRKELQKVLS